jgi:hypothetical protein
MTHERWSAGNARNQGSVSSIRATLAVASAPAWRSMRRSVADNGGVTTGPSDLACVTAASLSRPRRFPRSWSCGCPFADFVRFSANHNSKIDENGGGPDGL